MSTPLYIPDLIETVVAKVDAALFAKSGMHVYYDFGHHQEVLRQLQFKTDNPERPKKYPLIWLITPFAEERGGKDAAWYCTARLRFIIAHDTENNYSMKERRDNVFLPILYPVYFELLRQLQKSGAFAMGYEPAHRKLDVQIARLDDSGKNLFNDFVDVIDVQNMIIQVNNFC